MFPAPLVRAAAAVWTELMKPELLSKWESGTYTFSTILLSVQRFLSKSWQESEYASFHRYHHSSQSCQKKAETPVTVFAQPLRALELVQKDFVLKVFNQNLW